MKIKLKRVKGGASIEFKVDRRAKLESRDLKDVVMSMVTAGFDFERALRMLQERGYELDLKAKVVPDEYVIRRKQGEVTCDLDPL